MYYNNMGGRWQIHILYNVFSGFPICVQAIHKMPSFVLSTISILKLSNRLPLTNMHDVYQTVPNCIIIIIST